jgi:hypothetical protein
VLVSGAPWENCSVTEYRNCFANVHIWCILVLETEQAPNLDTPNQHSFRDISANSFEQRNFSGDLPARSIAYQPYDLEISNPGPSPPVAVQ